MDAQRIARPVLVAQSAAVAIQSKTGLALGGPLRRADVAFVSIASVHSAPVKPCHILPSRVVARRIQPNTTAPDLAMPYRGLSPLRAYPCPAVPKTAEPHSTGDYPGPPCPARSPLRAYPWHTTPCPATPHPAGDYRVPPSRTMPSQILPSLVALVGRILAQPRLASTRHISPYPTGAHPTTPYRPYGRIPGKPRRTASDPTSSRRTVPSRVLPRIAAFCRNTTCQAKPYHIALMGVSLPCPAVPRPDSSRRTMSYLAGPSLIQPRPTLSPLWGVSLPCPTVSRQVRPRTAVPDCAVSSHTEPCPANRPYGRIPALTSLASSRRAVSCLARPNLAVPCRDQHRVERKNPNTCALVGLLKTHGGCTDVRIVDHEPQQNSPRDVSLQQFQYTRNGRPCQQGVACERT
jgi:hypothetical protein